MKIFNRTLVFDFGSSKTIVCDEDGLIVFDEHTEISFFSDGKYIVGNKARGFYSREYEVVKPIVQGYVDNCDAFELYVKGVVRKLVRFPRLCLKTAIIAVPGKMIDDEDALQSFIGPFRKIGIKDIRFIPQSIGALHGSQMQHK